MIIKWRCRYWLAVILTLAVSGSWAADNGALAVAGQQRMLSQRLVKAWCQIGLNVMPTLSKTQLDEAVKRFEQNLTTLDAAASSAAARTALAGLRAAWSPLRSGALAVIRQSDAAQLDSRGEDVLLAAERLTRALQEQSATPANRWINLAGRQRMLSQRLVKIYLLRQWGVDSVALRDELERVQFEFGGALTTLQQRSENNAELRGELDNLALQWEWLRAALATEGSESFRLIVTESGEAVLELAERITQLYEQEQPSP